MVLNIKLHHADSCCKSETSLHGTKHQDKVISQHVNMNETPSAMLISLTSGFFTSTWESQQHGNLNETVKAHLEMINTMI